MLNYSLPCKCSSNLSSFWIILKQQWTIKISPPPPPGITGHNFGRTIPPKFGSNWPSGFRGVD